MTNGEDLIQKGYGWLLKEESRTRQDEALIRHEEQAEDARDRSEVRRREDTKGGEKAMGRQDLPENSF